MVLFDFFNSPVDSHTMVLVNHVISHGQFGKALNFLSLIGCFLSLALLFLNAEHVPFCDYYELNQRVLEPSVKISVDYQNLSRANCVLILILVRAVGLQAVFPQVSCQAACPRSGCRQKNNPVSVLFPPGKILDQHFKTVLIRIDILYCKAKFFVDGHPRQVLIQSGQIYRSVCLTSGQNLSGRVQKLRLAGQKISFFQTLNHTFSEFRFYGFPFFL